MSADTVLGPDLLLRHYAWQLLKLNDPITWDESKYGGLVPIVPLAEEPDLLDFGGPHIVYGYTEDTTADLWAAKSGTLTFAIYDNDFRRLGKTLNILVTAFERHDESADDVNKYTTLATFPPGSGSFLGIRFGCIYIGFVEGGTPETTEGGRQSALLNIRYDFFVDYGNNIRTDIFPNSVV